MSARSPQVALIGVVVANLALAGCARPPVVDVEPFPLADIEKVTPETWSLLAGQRIYFGHQSVGDNIMQGVAEVISGRKQIALEIRETAAPDALSEGVFAHGKVGRNFSYRSKLEAFTRLMDAGLGEHVDIALLKFCYVDVMPGADVSRMFRDYDDTLGALQKRYPATTFVHVSGPLTWRLTGGQAVLRRLKDRVKAILGMPGYGRFFDNRPRNRFNALLRDGYGGSEPLFDLAAIESSQPDGSRSAYRQAGSTYFSMSPAYTDDGGHLNVVGRRLVAEQLLIFLSNVAIERREGLRPAGEGPAPRRP